MKKQGISLLLSLGFAAAMLAGCAQDAAPVSSAPVSPAPDAASAAPTPEAAKALSVLTGREVLASEEPDTRFGAVMVSNSTVSRPLRGLSQADILMELPVEGGITRFIALYEDYPAMPEVGPVRGTREAFIQLAMPFQPLFVSRGFGQVAGEYIERFSLEERMADPFINSDSQAMQRDTARAADGYGIENTAYTSGALLAQDVDARGVDDAREYGSTFFSFVPPGEAPRALTGEAADAVELPFSESYRTYFDYTADSGQYQMSQYNSSMGQQEDTLDENTGTRVAFDNVLVLFAEMPPYEGFGSTSSYFPDIQLGLGGVGWYFNGGQSEAVRWTKQSPEHALQIVDANGQETPVALNPGTTYVGMVSVDNAEEFAYGTGGQLHRISPTEESA